MSFPTFSTGYLCMQCPYNSYLVLMLNKVFELIVIKELSMMLMIIVYTLSFLHAQPALSAVFALHWMITNTLPLL